MFKDFKNLFYRHGLVKNKEHKAWEFQVSWASVIYFNLLFKLDYTDFPRYPRFHIDILGLFYFEVSNTTERDHAGFTFSISLLGLSIEYHRYDTRHWDHNNDKWIEYDKDKNKA